MSSLRIVTVAGDIDLETILAEALGLRPDLELVLRCLDRVELLAAIRGADLNAVVLVGGADWFDRQLASEAATRDINVVGVSDEALPRWIANVLPTSASTGDIVAACLETRVDVPIPSASSSEASGRVTAVWGPKGSPGRTRVAIELAHVLVETGSSTLLMDADPYGGDILQCMNVVDEISSLIWATRMASKGELDDLHLEANLRRIPNGPVLLPGLPRADLWPDVGEFGFGELLAVCRGSFRHTVADAGFCLEPNSSVLPGAGEGRNRIARRVVGDADRTVAVCKASPLGIKNFLWAFEDLRTVVDPERVVVVINGAREGTERESARLLHRHIGKRPVAYIPDRPGPVAAALDEGTAASRRKDGSEIRAAIEALAISVGAKLRPRGVLTRLGARTR